MEATSRRGFLKQAGVGAAVVGTVVAIPKLTGHGSSAAATPAVTPAAPAELEGPLVAYLHDAKTGHFSLLVGTRSISFTDPDLAARLTNAAV